MFGVRCSVMCLLRNLCILLMPLLATSSSAFQNMVTTVDGIPENCVGAIDTSPFVKLGTKYYYFETVVPGNWYEAWNACRQMGADLVTIESAAEMDTLNRYLLNKKHHTLWFWTAGNDLGSQKNFRWFSNGKSMSFTRWVPGEPNNNGGQEHCVDIYIKSDQSDFLMNDLICSRPIHYICELRVPKTISVTVW